MTSACTLSTPCSDARPRSSLDPRQLDALHRRTVSSRHVGACDWPPERRVAQRSQLFELSSAGTAWNHPSAAVIPGRCLRGSGCCEYVHASCPRQPDVAGAEGNRVVAKTAEGIPVKPLFRGKARSIWVSHLSLRPAPPNGLVLGSRSSRPFFVNHLVKA